MTEASAAWSETDNLDAAAQFSLESSAKSGSNNKAVIQVVVGTSRMAAEDSSLIRRIANMANSAHGHMRFSDGEVRNRLAMGDAGSKANRVLHIAFCSGDVVGCCSSTIQPPWTSGGCGHWGALSVDPKAQGTGVASALVAAAEQRLSESGCTRIQIEYEYTAGDAYSERLARWYEGKLGFSGGPLPRNGTRFRCLSKSIGRAMSTPTRSASEPDITSGRLCSVSHMDQTTADSSGKKVTCFCSVM